jgi:hypothetical protein
MEEFTDKQKSGSAAPTQTHTPMEKPQIHTTESGTQYVRTVDVVRSRAGWAEIQRLKEANLVRPSASANGGNSSSEQSNDNNDLG